MKVCVIQANNVNLQIISASEIYNSIILYQLLELVSVCIMWYRENRWICRMVFSGNVHITMQSIVTDEIQCLKIHCSAFWCQIHSGQYCTLCRQLSSKLTVHSLLQTALRGGQTKCRPTKYNAR